MFFLGDNEMQGKNQSPEIQQHVHITAKPETESGPVPVPAPEPSCVSMKSDCSKQSPPYFSGSVDERNPPRTGLLHFEPNVSGNDGCCPLNGCEPSAKKRKSDSSDRSYPGFRKNNLCSRDGTHHANHRFQTESMTFSRHQSISENRMSIFSALEKEIVAFVRNESNHISRAVDLGYPKDDQRDSEGGEDEQQKRSSREAFSDIAIHFLRRMKQERSADLLQSRTSAAVGRSKLNSRSKEKFWNVFEGIPKEGNQTSLNQIYTEPYVTKGGHGAGNDQHEVAMIERSCRESDKGENKVTHKQIFESSPGKLRPTRTVMTKGVAGIGKTVLIQKFASDWAEDKTNQNIDLVFPFMFRELNASKDTQFSLVELVHHFFAETKEILRLEDFQVVFIFDGLDECRLPLDFRNNEISTDVTQPASVGASSTNLITGYLFPSARLWITTRPAAANQIPPECVDMVTEVRGFPDRQKEQYFKKRVRNEEQARKIISHIKTSRTLHTMCHIPVFCWITATVSEEVFKSSDEEKLPNTSTEMYIHFLVVQTKVKSLKYDGGAETDHWSPENRKMIKSLGTSAFQQSQKGNLIFTESDLRQCGIDAGAVSISSGVFTQMFKEERGGLSQNKVFSFVHSSVQEFLAALHVHLSFFNSDVNLSEQESPQSVFEDFYQSAVNSALKSPNGHSDLFLRFLSGLSSPSNQTLLLGLQKKTGVSPQADVSPIAVNETSRYIKEKLNGGLSVEKSISLLYCSNESNDHSLVEKIQQSLTAGQLSTDEMSPADWSASAFLLSSSEKDLDVFDSKKYSASSEALTKSLPVVEAANKASSSGCNSSEGSFELLSSVLSSESSVSRELDLSNNNLKDSGVKQLSSGLSSPHCKSEILRLSLCNLDEKSCETSSSVLSSQYSSSTEMDSSNNDLQDSGLKSLSSGSESPHCKLRILRLSGCLVTEKGCRASCSALDCNPSHSTESDSSYNHPGDSGMELFSAKSKDQNWRSDVLRMEPFGEQWLRPGLRKYYFKPTFDTNTINRQIKLSNNRKAVHVREDQSYTDHPERFQDCPQSSCRDEMIGRHYCVVEWSGWVDVSVSNRGISRRVERADCRFGGNDKSWSSSCSDGGGFYVYHQKKRSFISPSFVAPKMIGVYVDRPAGSVSFYRICNGAPIHSHTFSARCTEPSYLGLGFRFRFRSETDSFASSCSSEEFSH